MTMLRRAGFAAGVVLAGCLAGSLAVEQARAAVSRSGVISKFDGVDESAGACTTAGKFVAVPQMSRAFSVGGSAGSVLVTFSGSASLSGQTFGTGYIQLTIDNVPQSPGKVPFVEAGEINEAHAFTWQSKPLAAGSHTVRVQWRTDPGLSFCLDARSLVVLHR